MSWMHHAEPQFVSEPIITLAYLPDEFGTQLLGADFISWTLLVYQQSRAEPLLLLTDQDIALVLSDTALPWPPSVNETNQLGYTFRHDLVYGEEYEGALFLPAVGHPVRLEYTLHRTPNTLDQPRGPILIGKVQPIRDWQSAGEQ